MKEQFTKEEAFSLLGESVIIKNTVYFDQDGIKYPLINAGVIAPVYIIENSPEGLMIVLLIDGDYSHFDKEGFDTYCQLVKPEIIHHACSV